MMLTYAYLLNMSRDIGVRKLIDDSIELIGSKEGEGAGKTANNPPRISTWNFTIG